METRKLGAESVGQRQEAAWGGSELSIPGGMQGRGECGKVLAGSLQKPPILTSGQEEREAGGVGLPLLGKGGTAVARGTQNCDVCP